MPFPKKKTAANGEAPVAGPSKPKSNGLSEYELPRSTILKIVKASLPPNVKMQKEVPLALTKSSTVFISYLTSLAQDATAAKKQKTVSADHVLSAIEELDWGESDTAALRKDLKKQLRAFRKRAELKKQGLPMPETKLKATRTEATSAREAEIDENAAEGSAEAVTNGGRQRMSLSPEQSDAEPSAGEAGTERTPHEADKAVTSDDEEEPGTDSAYEEDELEAGGAEEADEEEEDEVERVSDGEGGDLYALDNADHEEAAMQAEMDTLREASTDEEMGGT